MPEPQARMRVTYAKFGPIRYTGHLDLQRVWERTLRRSALPVAYSQGFHPQARLQMACALPLGINSACEVMDFWLDEEIPLQQVAKALSRAAPPGIGIKGVSEADLHEPPLQTRILSAEYVAVLDDDYPPDALAEQVQLLLSSQNLWRTRRDKRYDLRPLLESLAIDNPGEVPVRLRMRLSAKEAATGRPEEVLAALQVKFETAQVERTALFFSA